MFRGPAGVAGHKKNINVLTNSRMSDACDNAGAITNRLFKYCLDENDNSIIQACQMICSIAPHADGIIQEHLSSQCPPCHKNGQQNAEQKNAEQMSD